MSEASATHSQTYGIQRWGEGYFGVNAEGHISVRPNPERQDAIDLFELANEVRHGGLNWPVLIRFTDILHHRVRALSGAFAHAADEFDFAGGYTSVYPIKVNQQKSVIAELLNGGRDRVGLEAGSKPELMAVLALAPPGGTIVCNGYKDREYIRLALIGKRLGHRVFIVLEKAGELDLVLQEAADLGIAPDLGVRVRLAAIASGNWQNSGGEHAKFGLSAAQLLALVDRLKAENKLDWLKLLHSHIGSQIPNLRDIHAGISEAARYYGELRRLGVPIEVVDVGGGLGVDYEGTATRNFCSINYGLEGYAREVTKALAQVCGRFELPHPEIFTESGRALTAHHAVLISEVIDREPAPGGDVPQLTDTTPEPLRRLHDELVAMEERPPQEVYQETRHLFEEILEAFQQGELPLEIRAQAELLYFEILGRLRTLLSPLSRQHRELLDRLNQALADRLYCNFSLFQSLPDVWAIDQIFPVTPLHRLNEQPSASGLLNDLTCDSDGCLQLYVDQDGVEQTLPVHEPNGEPYLLGFFLVGAYQEILGDMHNLFGDTDAVNVELTGQGGYRLVQPERGDSVDELLRYVHFDPDEMLANYMKKLKHAGLGEALLDDYYRELKAGLQGYSYLEV